MTKSRKKDATRVKENVPKIWEQYPVAMGAVIGGAFVIGLMAGMWLA